ncbi:MAG: hypothetical protein IJK86_09715 [Lachnospiraceae bacterium]|nr:hypothetical protein [Lachnospiraceae bacterium]
MGKDITCTIEKELAVLSTNDHGYTKELNYVSWNGAEAKLDIRQWWPGREKSGKGVTLTEEEGRNLRDALIALFAGKEGSQ